MPKEEQAKQAEKYFNEWADDYERAFEKAGDEKSFLQRVINLGFRRKTFRLRTQHLSELVVTIDVEGKDVLDIGCGTGQLAFEVFHKGGRVTGLDISEEMINICRAKAKTEDIEDKIKFHVCDCIKEDLPQADIVFCIAVIEYYKDIIPFLQKLCASTRYTLILCDARYIWWRAYLRKFLAFLKGFEIFYHDPEQVKTVIRECGMQCVKEIALHSFRTLVFERDSQR